MITEENLEPITHFEDEFFFLSNFHPCEVVFEGMTFPTTEHAYQAAKSLDHEIRAIIARLPKAGQAKRFPKKHNLPIRDGWDTIKFGIMEEILRLKFSQPFFKNLLLATGNRLLVEENTWDDTLWGVCFFSKKGDNMLGKLLMQIRAELRGDSFFTY